MRSPATSGGGEGTGCARCISARALVQIAVTSKNASLFTVETSSPKHRVPDLRRSLALNAQTSQSELSLADALQ